MKKLFLVSMLLGATAFVRASSRALVVIAHPDDESILSVTLYKLAKEQHATWTCLSLPMAKLVTGIRFWLNNITDVRLPNESRRHCYSKMH